MGLILTSVADPDPGWWDPVPFYPWIRDPGWVKIRIWIWDPNPVWTTRIIFPRAKEKLFGLKYLNSLMRIRDPGCKQFRSGIGDQGWKKVGSWLRDKHPGSATLILTFFCCSGRPPAFSQQQLQQRQCEPFRPTAAALLRPATTALPAAAATTAASTGSPIVCLYSC